MELQYFDVLPPEIQKQFLNTYIHVEEKEDGYNTTIAENSNFIRVYSRNQLANEHFQIVCKKIIRGYNKAFFEYLHSEYHFIMELKPKGKSPAMHYVYDEDSLVGLDIRLPDGSYATYDIKEKIFKECGIVGARRDAVIYFRDLDKLKRWIIIQRNHGIKLDKEGYVYKTDKKDKYGEPLYFKDRTDIDKLRTRSKRKLENKLRRQLQPKEELPPLPDGESRGAVAKVYAELSKKEFRDIRIAMPKVAYYINVESKKHKCRPPNNMVKFYKEFLENL